MTNDQITDLIAKLEKRIAGRQNSIAAVERNPSTVDPELSKALNQAHIDELE